MNKKAVAVVGGVAGALGIAYLVSRVVAKPTVQVALTSKPIHTVILVDDKLEVATPKILSLPKGTHKFAAVPKSPDLVLTYASFSVLGGSPVRWKRSFKGSSP